MGWLVIIGSVPIVVLGLLFQDAIDSALRNLWITAAMLAGFGVVIGVADRLARNARPLESLTWGHGVLFGLAQSLALVPGVSRSGATISAGLALGYTREAAARYSFLLAIPAVVGLRAVQAGRRRRRPGAAGLGADRCWPPSSPSSSATRSSPGCCATSRTHDFMPFVVYRIGLALSSRCCC